jgi:DNA-binding NtrC family response regulator
MKIDALPDTLFAGSSPAMRELRADLSLAIGSDAPVMLAGEDGVGREAAARMIHRRSARRQAPLAAMHCAGVHDSLLQSLLFGPAPTGGGHGFAAARTLPEAAANGSMFLKDVDALSGPMQDMLFAFLDTDRTPAEGVRCTRESANVRLITAASHDVAAEVAAGRFHESLYYRLNVIYIAIPALRDRAEDVPELLTRFLNASGRFDAAQPHISVEALDLLTAYAWPGNLPELRRVAEVLARKASHREIVAADLPPYFSGGVLTRAGAGAAQTRRAEAAEAPAPGWTIAHPMTDFSICH